MCGNPRRPPRSRQRGPLHTTSERKRGLIGVTYPQNEAGEWAPCSHRAKCPACPVFMCQVIDSIEQTRFDARQRQVRANPVSVGRMGDLLFFAHKVIHRLWVAAVCHQIKHLRRFAWAAHCFCRLSRRGSVRPGLAGFVPCGCMRTPMIADKWQFVTNLTGDDGPCLVSSNQG